MKKQIFSFEIAAAMIGSIAAGCGASKNASSVDSAGTKMDTATKKMSTDTMRKDTSMKKDTMKKDTTHHWSVKKMPAAKYQAGIFVSFDLKRTFYQTAISPHGRSVRTNS